MKPFSSKRTFHNNKAYSLIELMITAGIIGIIAIGIARFSSSFQSNQAKSDARSTTHDMNRRLLGFIQRDFRYQSNFQVKPGNLSLEIRRRQQYTAEDSDASYLVTYSSECVSPPSSKTEFAQFISEVYGSANRSEIYSEQNQCLKLLNCPNGQYPRVRITTNISGERIPSYNPSIFPDLNDTPTANELSQRDLVRRGAVGTAICFFSSGSRIRVISESIFLTGKVEGVEKIQVSRNESLISSSNIAGVEILPNEN